MPYYLQNAFGLDDLIYLLFLLRATKSQRDWKHYDTAWQTLFRSYGRCIAEFLNEESLVRLGLLDLSTCVGLRYGRQYT